MDDQINDTQYMKLSSDIEREQIKLEDIVMELKKTVKKVILKKKEKEKTIHTYKELGEIREIDRETVDKLINKIIISKEGRVELEWNFKNIFNV